MAVPSTNLPALFRSVRTPISPHFSSSFPGPSTLAKRAKKAKKKKKEESLVAQTTLFVCSASVPLLFFQQSNNSAKPLRLSGGRGLLFLTFMSYSPSQQQRGEQLRGLLETNEKLQDLIRHGQERVERELRILDGLRQGLTLHRLAPHSAKRVVLFARWQHDEPQIGTKRLRPPDHPEVAYTNFHLPFSRDVSRRLGDPFQDAGLYAQKGNPLVCQTELPLSKDEQRVATIEACFPPNPSSLPAPSKAKRPQWETQIRAAMAAADLSEDDYVFSDPPAAPLRIPSPPPLTQSFLSFFAPENSILLRLRDRFWADTQTLATSLYAEAADYMRIRNISSTSLRTALQVFQLPSYRRANAFIADWTFHQCCTATDPDVEGNTRVLWSQTLAAAAPQSPARYADRGLYCLIWCLLVLRLHAASSLRGAYVGHVLALYSRSKAVIDVTKLRPQAVAAARLLTSRSSEYCVVSDTAPSLLG